MTLGDLDMAMLANSAFDAAMDDILTKLLTHLKVDASNITFEALLQRLIDIALASITLPRLFYIFCCYPSIFSASRRCSNS